MRLTEKLLGYLNRVFDKEPKRFIAMRVQYNGTMTWSVVDDTLTTTVVGGSGVGLTIDLRSHTLATMANLIAASSGYTVTDLDLSKSTLSARVLLEGAGSDDETNGGALFGYTSLLWAYLEAVGGELKIARSQITEAIDQLETPKADGYWLDEWGTYYNVPRLDGEADVLYAPRIIAEVLRPRSNNIAIAQVIEAYTGQACSVTDVVVYGDVFPLHNGAIHYDGVYHYDVVTPPIYGLFDVDYAYDLINGGDLTEFQDSIERLIDITRAAGTHLRALALAGGVMNDDIAPPVETMSVIDAVMPLTDAVTAPTESLAPVVVTIADMSDAVTPATESDTADLLDLQTFNGIRQFNGTRQFSGGNVLRGSVDGSAPTTVPVLDLNFMTGSYYLSGKQPLLSSVSGWSVQRASHGFAPTLAGAFSRFYTARTNMIVRSNDFSTTWGKSGTTTLSAGGAGPFVGTTATLFAASALSSYINQTAGSGTVASTHYTASVYAKAGTLSTILLQVGDAVSTNGANAKFTLSGSGSVSAGPFNFGSGSNSFAHIEAVGGGWYRCVITATISGVNSGILVTNSDVGVGNFYTYGAQFEAGVEATPYMETGASTVTVSAVDARVTDRGLLPEETRTNYCPTSTPANGMNGINRTNGGASLLFGTTSLLTRSGTGSAFCSLTLTSSRPLTQVVTASAIVKAGVGGRWGLRIQGTYPARADAVFDLVGGTVVGTAASSFSGQSATITALSGGFYRITLTATVGGSVALNIITGPTDSTAGGAAIGSWEGGSSVLSSGEIDALQLEDGANATSPIITRGLARTRDTDVIKVTGLAALLAKPCTIMVEFEAGPTAANQFYLAVGNTIDGLGLTYTALRWNGVATVIPVRQNGALVGDITLNAVRPVLSSNKMVGRLRAADIAGAVNGGSYTAGATSQSSAMDTLMIGSLEGTAPCNTFIKRVRVFPTGVADADVTGFSS